MMTLDLIFIIIGFIGLVFASISDWKTREVPDWLNYGLITIGIGLRIIYTTSFNDFSVLFSGLIGFGAMFALGNLMYYSRQWGGGDAKLMMAMGVLFPYDLNFLLGLVSNIFIFGAVYGLGWAVFLAIKNRDSFVKEFKKLSKENIKIKRMILIVSVALLLIALIINQRNAVILASSIALLLILYSHLRTVIHAIESTSMHKFITPKKLTPGDWLAKDVYVGKKLLLKIKRLGLEKEDIALLKKSKVKKVLVKEGIPFVPSFLIGFIISLVMGNVILLFF